MVLVGRRSILQLAGAGLFAVVLPTAAQSALARVVWFSPGRAEEGTAFFDALRLGLRERGYAEDRNLILEARWADNTSARADVIAAELAAEKFDVIVAQGTTVYAVRKAGIRAPIVFAFSGDPVEAGLVRSLARPENNLTGISFLALELVGKRIELLKAVVPGLKRIAVVANSQHPGDQAERRASSNAAAALGLSVEFFETGNTAQLDASLAEIAKARCEAAVLFPVQSVISNSARIAVWSLRQRIPTISGWAPFADHGNLLSYGCNLHTAFRQLANYVDRILKGTSPGALPVELPMQIELVVNLKTARALGLTLPQSVMLRTHRVIE